MITFIPSDLSHLTLFPTFVRPSFHCEVLSTRALSPLFSPSSPLSLFLSLPLLCPPPRGPFRSLERRSDINKIKKGMLFVSPVFLSSPSAPLFLFLFLFGLTDKNENGESENKREEDEKGETTLSPSRACVHVSEETREAI